jgi:hypothetical protein
VALTDSAPNDGEAPVIVGMADAAMHRRIKDLIAALGG